MKKTLCVVAVFALLVSSAAMVLAAQDVTNPSQKGSVTIYPKIVVLPGPTNDQGNRPGPITSDTVVTLVNDYTTFIDVKCYWMDEYQKYQDFLFRLTRSQPVWFRASDGSGMQGSESLSVPPFEGRYGELACWAVDPTGQFQVNHNHLFGTATIYDYKAGTAWEYSSWNFAARYKWAGTPPAPVVPPFPKRGGKVGTGGIIRLTGENDGRSYDACPQYILGTFMAADSDFEDLDKNKVDLSTTDLTLTPCRQDLTQDYDGTITKAEFDIWNEDEVKSTGAWLCFKCWIETPLRTDPKGPDGATGGYIGHLNFDKFSQKSLHTDFGFFRTTGVKSDRCSGSVESPLIGVISKRVLLTDGATGTQLQAEAGTNVNTAGKYPYNAASPVTMLWDTQSGHPESNQR